VPSLIACVSSTSLQDLYHRFGYPTLQILKKLVPRLGQLSSLGCESCQMGKYHRVPYSRVNKRADHLFELIHSNIWRPCPVSLTLSFKYFVTIWVTFIVWHDYI